MLTKKIVKSLLLFFSAFIISCSSSLFNNDDNSVVGHLGLIHVKGNKVVDKNDSTVALHGMSLFWSQWGGDFYNEECIKWLRDDWKCSIIRAACGVEMGGYLKNPEKELKKITSVIDACIKYGIYVIVDWHDHSAQNHLEQSKDFFNTIAKKYGDEPNIIYEIYNEPWNDISWGDTVKPYAEEVIKVIRQYDPDNLIVVGSPHWSQDVDVAAKDPIKDVNLAYTVHFYTSTHKQWLRDKTISAIDTSGVPVFVSEYGISEANGNGKIDYTETDNWLTFVNKYQLSTCNWSVIDKDETSAVLKPGTRADGNWKESDLTESGTYIRNYIRQLNNTLFLSLEKGK